MARQQEYLLVRFPETRIVLIDGVPQGKTNLVLSLEAGVHTVALDPDTGLSQPEQSVVLDKTTAGEPLIVTFQATQANAVAQENVSDQANAPAQRAAARAPMPEGWILLDQANALKPSRTMTQVLSLAEGRARGAGVPIDATLLLFALADTGPGQKEHNTAWLLAERIGGGFSAMQGRLQEHIERSPERDRWRDGPVYFTADAWRVMAAARDLQRRVSRKDPYVSARHVMAAFLASPEEQPPAGALALLTTAGVDLDELRAAFRTTILDSKLPDDPETWRRLPLRPVIPRAVISRFNADLSAGDDKLGIQSDVNAMANLMASRALVPPLSVGLFGNWGSGKSFFITKLQAAVSALSKRADTQQPGFRDAYWPKIVQVQFNAWHFVDANLWASLVSHIFEELHRWDTKAPQVVQQAKIDALGKLRVAKEAREAADAHLTQAKEAHAKAVSVRQERIDQFDTRRGEFAAAVGKDVWEAVGNLLGGVGKQEREELEKLGVAVGSTAADAQRMYAQLTELQTLPGRLYTAGTVMLGGSAWIPALVVFLVMMAGVLGVALVAGDARTLVSLFGQGTALATGAAVWLGRGMKGVSSALKPVQQFHARLDKRLKDEEAKKAAEVAKLDKEVQRLQADCAEATKLVDQTQQKVQEAEAEVHAAETGRLITRFIEQRASSADYRKHLGVVSLIRDDFDELSQLIKAYNDFRVLPAKPDAPTPEDLGINRIILYIDDLDRCPADRVVEVLQAIHLLLAFPLFVVVVAVDARWMATSLQTQYKDMLKERAAARAQNGGVTTAPATPRDYLEKIFQVPFWVQPMVPAGTRSLIEELLKFDVAAEGGPTATAAGAPSPGAAPTPGAGSIPAAAMSKPVEDPSPERLRIDEVEASAMAQLASIIGRSPRATKRFVNVYRLLKAALPTDELEAFVGTSAAPGGFRAPMLLLAVTTGLPMLTGRVFHEVIATKPGPRRMGAMLKEILAAAPDGGDEELADERRRLTLFLAAPESGAWTAVSVAQLRPWVVRIAQFTFDARAI
jgi:hypothetical protein